MGNSHSPQRRPPIRISDAERDQLGRQLDIPPGQIDIAQAFLDGYSKPADIAKALGIRASSVKTQTQRLFKRLDAHTKADVVVTVLGELLNMRSNGGPSAIASNE